MGERLLLRHVSLIVRLVTIWLLIVEIALLTDMVKRQMLRWLVRLSGCSPLNGCESDWGAWWKVMAAYRRVYDWRHQQADCQEPGSASEPHVRQSSTGCLFIHSAVWRVHCIAFRCVGVPGHVTLGGWSSAPLLRAWRCLDSESSETATRGRPAVNGRRSFALAAACDCLLSHDRQASKQVSKIIVIFISPPVVAHRMKKNRTNLSKRNKQS